MKKTLLIIGLVLVSLNGFAQFGIKGGLNYNSNGEYKEILTSGENIIENNGESKVGYNFGVFYKMDLISGLYLRPELVYTKTKSEYQSNSYDLSKIDLPVLVGVEIVGPLSLFAGPSFQYVLNNDFENNTIEDVKNDITVGLHFGAALKLGNLGLDVRYERGFTENEAKIYTNNVNVATIDSRPSQLIFSLSFDLENKN